MKGPRRVALVPAAPALKAQYLSIRDPLPRLRSAVSSAVAWVGPGGVVVCGNGSATRTERAPGHFDERAEPFDDELRQALFMPDPLRIRSVDPQRATQLWADTGAFTELADLLVGTSLTAVDYDDAPYGVQYWVLRWSRG